MILSPWGWLVYHEYMAKQSRLSGALAVTVAQAVVLALGYVTHLWIGNVLGPASYGIYGIVLSVQTIIGLFLTLGVPTAVSRFVARDRSHASSILSQALRIQAVIALMIAVGTITGAPWLALALRDASLTRFVYLIAVILFFQAFYPVFTQFFGGLQHWRRQATLTNVYAVAKLAGAIGLAYLFGVPGALMGFAIGGLVAAVIGWIWSRRLKEGAPRLVLPVKEFLRFAGLYVLILAGLQLLVSLDLLMVKYFLQENVVTGYYNAASTVARIPFLLLQGLAFVLLPSVSALTKPGESHEQAVKFIRDTLRYLIALVVPGVALAAATSKGLLELLFFSSAYVPAAPVLSILIIGVGSLAFYQLLISIVAGAGRAKVGFGITILMLIISAIAGRILIPRFELMGAAWQTTIAGLSGLMLLAAYTFYTFKIPLPARSIVNILIASAAATVTTYLWPHSTMLLPLQYIAALIVYIAALYLLGEITKGDRQRLASLHPGLKFLAR